MIVDRNLISAVEQFASRIDAVSHKTCTLRDWGLLQKYSKMSNGELHLIWRTLFRFFQDRRVHVSLFLNRGYQLRNGTLVRPTKGDLKSVPVVHHDQITYLRTWSSRGRFVTLHRMEASQVKIGLTILWNMPYEHTPHLQLTWVRTCECLTSWRHRHTTSQISGGWDGDEANIYEGPADCTVNREKRVIETRAVTSGSSDPTSEPIKWRVFPFEHVRRWIYWGVRRWSS